MYHWIETGRLDRDLDEEMTPRTRAAGLPKVVPVNALIAERIGQCPRYRVCGCAPSVAR